MTQSSYGLHPWFVGGLSRGKFLLHGLSDELTQWDATLGSLHLSLSQDWIRDFHKTMVPYLREGGLSLPDNLPGDDTCHRPTAEACAIERRVTALGEGFVYVVSPLLLCREDGDIGSNSRRKRPTLKT